MILRYMEVKRLFLNVLNPWIFNVFDVSYMEFKITRFDCIYILFTYWAFNVSVKRK